MGKNETPVVITRKDKRIRHKMTHLFAFALTGGASGIVTAAEAANHATYNARTRRLQAEAEHAAAMRGQESPAGHSAMLATAAGNAARKAIRSGIPRDQLGLAAQAAYDRIMDETARKAIADGTPYDDLPLPAKVIYDRLMHERAEG